MRDGLRVDDAIVLGSPGMGVDHERDLNLDGGRLYALNAPGDPVAWLQAFGQDPTSPDFGGVRLQTNVGASTPIGGHSDYFIEETESLENVVRVVRGDLDDVAIKPASLGDHVGEFARDRWRSMTGENVADPALDGIRDHLPVPEPVDDGVDLVDLGYTGKVSRSWSPFGSARDTTTSQDRGGFSDDLGGGVGPAGDAGRVEACFAESFHPCCGFELIGHVVVVSDVFGDAGRVFDDAFPAAGDDEACEFGYEPGCPYPRREVLFGGVGLGEAVGQQPEGQHEQCQRSEAEAAIAADTVAVGGVAADSGDADRGECPARQYGDVGEAFFSVPTPGVVLEAFLDEEAGEAGAEPGDQHCGDGVGAGPVPGQGRVGGEGGGTDR